MEQSVITAWKMRLMCWFQIMLNQRIPNIISKHKYVMFQAVNTIILRQCECIDIAVILIIVWKKNVRVYKKML